LLWCRVTSVLFPEAGQDYGFTTLEDISVRKALEAQHQQSSQQLSTINEALLITNEELASTNEELITTNTELQLANTHLAHTNAELDSFVYAASHDLKAPIVNLEGLLLALTQQLPAEVRRLDQVAPILEMMQDAIVRFRHTLDYLTDIGSIQVDGTRPREKISLAGVVEEVRRDVEPLLFTTGGRLEVDLADNPTLFYYPGNLRSVVYNLISNALKYRHPDRPPVVYVQSQRNRNQLLLRVQDNGLGLSAEQQLQLFRLFRRLHSHVDGSGVGLYLVKKILDTTGGSIRVESQLGRGSTFTVTFPS
jgi:signal transduction histidine kinase